MTPHSPLISVIVPVHNVADHVGASIDSLRAQTMRDFEALVIDDGSTDDSGARALEAIDGDPRFRLIRQENRGLSGARNTGLEAARGAFIAFLDSDDQFAPTFLERMHDALVADGGDWVACAIALTFPDGAAFDHSAIHGAPVLQPGPARRIALDDCTAIVRHFPSAWNKLYRRSLVEGLRFREGTWFEDHEFYWSLVARTGHLLYLPEPLYRHARERPGQITGADDERVFEQFAVLERLAGLVHDSGAAHPGTGLARLASRLVHERAGVVQDPDRRARFMRAAAEFFVRHDLAYSFDWDADISAAPGLLMAGILPLSVTLHSLGADPALTAATLRALEAQSMPDFELLSDDPALAARGLLANGAPVAALPTGPEGTRGRYLVTLRAGDQPGHDCFKVWLNGMERLGAALGFSGYERGTWEDGEYRLPFIAPDAEGADVAEIPPSGGRLPLTPLRALRLSSEPALRIVRRDLALATRLPPRLAPLGGQAMLLAQLHAAQGCALFPFPALAVPPRPEPVPDAGPFRLAWAISAARRKPPFADLPAGWEALLMARALQPTLEAVPEGPRRDRLLVQTRRAAWLFRLRADPGLPADPAITPQLRQLLGLSASAG